MSNDKNRELCELLGWKQIGHENEKGPVWVDPATRGQSYSLPKYYDDPVFIPRLMEAMVRKGFIACVHPIPYQGDDPVALKIEYAGWAFEQDDFEVDGSNAVDASMVITSTPQAALAEACRKALKEGKDG